ncbi:hypothetical protein FACS1894208_11410 [Clostridia bacterium]|nr:hypothetical protein FACS1894208_11410 [Clostridia bacterium]
MAGVPTNKDLYFAVGGSEFIVDFQGVLRKENTAKRTYQVHYDGIACEHKDGDQAKTINFPGGYSTTGHAGGSFTKTWTGTTPWTGSGGVSGASAWVSNSWSDSSYNATLAEAQAFASSVNAVSTSHTAVSDKQTRTKSGWGAAASGSNSHISGYAVQGQNYIAPTYKDGKMTDLGQPFIAGEYSPGTANGWTITVSWSVPAHATCGPCCQHDLPAINDTWTQEIPYDYLDFQKAEVWRLENGVVTGMSTITGSTNEVTASVLQGTLFLIAKNEVER